MAITTLDGVIAGMQAPRYVARPLASIACLAAQVTDAIDALTGGMPRLFDGSVPYFFFVPSTTTTTGIHASVVLTQG